MEVDTSTVAPPDERFRTMQSIDPRVNSSRPALNVFGLYCERLSAIV